MTSTRYLFVMGAARSGTSFLASALNRSPFIFLTSELQYFSSLYHNGFLKNLRSAMRTKNQFALDDLFRLVQSKRFFGYYWLETRDFSRDEIDHFFSDKEIDPKNVYEFLLGHDVPAAIARNARLNFIGEKTPLNIFHLPCLFTWFPDCHVIFIHRNPLDVLKSEINKEHKPDYPMPKESPLYALGLIIYVFFEWLVSALIALHYRCVRIRCFHIVSYENLVANCHQSMEQICSAIGIPYDDDLCRVPRFGSSYSAGEKRKYWSPPKIVVSLYRLLLNPVRRLLNKASLNTLQ